jgi:hypothetical protein
MVHVQNQQAYAKERIMEVKGSLNNFRYLGVPHFGGEQPGDTYYYSPVSVYCFGVVEICSEQDQLYAYGYTEDNSAKGGNNIVSLLMKALQDLG